MSIQLQPSKSKYRLSTPAMIALGLASLVTACNTALAQNKQLTGAAIPSTGQTPLSLPPLRPTPIPFTPTLVLPPTSTTTPWPSPTPWPTPTAWPMPVAWQPTPPALPTLAPLPAVMTVHVGLQGALPVSYSPPDGVDVFGNTILRWTYYGPLAADEFFDVKIKPVGRNDSVFIDWTKSTEYELRPWSGWQPGLYTWQIGIVKGYLEGEIKHFIADTGRDSQPFLIKWQGTGGGGSNGAAGGGGGNSSGGS